MTPADRTAKNLQEYTECRKTLTVLHGRLIAVGEDLDRISRALRRGQPLLNLERLAAFKEALDDYRATRKRCADLCQFFGRYGTDDAIEGLSEFPRY